MADIIAITGHRPDKLGGYSDQARLRLEAFAIAGVELFVQNARAPTGTYTDVPSEMPGNKGYLKCRIFDLRPIDPVFHIGGALGWDQAVWTAVLTLGLKHRLLLPFPGQEERWPSEAQSRYKHLLRRSMESGLLVEPVRYKIDHKPVDFNEATRALYDRNGDIVEGCSHCLAMWNGDLNGGTAQALRLIETLPQYPQVPNTVLDTVPNHPWPRIANAWPHWLEWNGVYLPD